MSALGIAAAGAGQGYAQGVDWRNQRQNQQQQYGLQERQVKLAEQGQAQDEAFRREQAARGELDKQDMYLNSPEFSTKLSPEQQERIRVTFGERRSQIYRDFPHLSDSAFAETAGNEDQGQANQTWPGTPGISPEGSPFANVQATQLPDGTPQATLPGEVVPTPHAAPAAKPVAGPPAPTDVPSHNQSLYAFFSQQAHDASLPLETRNAAAAQAMQIRKDEAAIANTESGTAMNVANTREIAPNASNQRAVGNQQIEIGKEQVRSSRYDRNVVGPKKLKIEEQRLAVDRATALAQMAQQRRLTRQEQHQYELELRKLGVTKDQFERDLGYKYAELGVQREGQNIKAGGKPGQLSDVDKMEGDILGKAAFNTTPMGKVTGPSPIYNTWKEWLQAHRAGSAGSAGGGDYGARVKQYLARTDLTPAQKVAGLRQLGVPPPPELLAKARKMNGKH